MKLGNQQLRIMEQLWAAGPLSARDLTDRLAADGKGGPMAHSTVQTQLRALLNKGAVAYDRRGRAFEFRALVGGGQTRREATRRFAERFHNGSTRAMICDLIASERLSGDDLSEIRRLIDRHDKAGESTDAAAGE
ncbi:MAG: BlaI/MecI/CopY family transcriptional regulator [Planctomycetota bacterium]